VDQETVVVYTVNDWRKPTTSVALGKFDTSQPRMTTSLLTARCRCNRAAGMSRSLHYVPAVSVRVRVDDPTPASSFRLRKHFQQARTERTALDLKTFG